MAAKITLTAPERNVLLSLEAYDRPVSAAKFARSRVETGALVDLVKMGYVVSVGGAVELTEKGRAAVERLHS